MLNLPHCLLIIITQNQNWEEKWLYMTGGEVVKIVATISMLSRLVLRLELSGWKVRLELTQSNGQGDLQFAYFWIA